ncbi:hypothetical protein [Planomonospora venezuelensis]|uniref:Uncharacterized protein n=1 Tax=Planomonospora venezuelensis TaxID=1999 RepID=A0A841DA42_PLAVE|nr:hypothetical protein [Planomonospora venezuelensis]MBB5964256.1 hypothetical protein [Planomonospora venezuelensis]GIN02573.1 hypothetical protein Pve01_42310 [Planomonospora venezuelensis]
MRPSGTGPAGDPPFEDRLADFYSPAVSLSRLRPRADGGQAPPDLLLRVLEPPEVRVRHIPLVDLLRKPYRELGDDGSQEP